MNTKYFLDIKQLVLLATDWIDLLSDRVANIDFSSGMQNECDAISSKTFTSLSELIFFLDSSFRRTMNDILEVSDGNQASYNYYQGRAKTLGLMIQLVQPMQSRINCAAFAVDLIENYLKVLADSLNASRSLEYSSGFARAIEKAAIKSSDSTAELKIAIAEQRLKVLGKNWTVEKKLGALRALELLAVKINLLFVKEESQIATN